MWVHVILVNGRHAVGKDAFIDYCRDYANKQYDTYSESSIDRYKKILTDLGWNGKKTHDVRQLLSDLKRFAINHGDLPTKEMLGHILNTATNGDNNYDTIYFVQIREDEEIEKLELALSGLHYIGITFDKVFISGNCRDNTSGSSSDMPTCDDSYTIIKNNGDLKDLDRYACEYMQHNIFNKYH